MSNVPDVGSTGASSERTVTAAAAASPPIVAGNSLTSAHHFVSIKLTNRNYLFWRTQLLPFLRGQGLLGYVDGSLLCPPEPPAATGDTTSAAAADVDPSAGSQTAQTAALRLAWRQQDQAILSMLISSLSEEVMHHAVGCSTSRRLWLALEQSLGSATRSRALRLLGQLQSLQQGDASVADYLGRAQLLVEDLALAGRTIGLDDQNLYVFRGLRPEFRPLVATLTTGDPVTLSELSDFLSAQEFICAGDGDPS